MWYTALEKAGLKRRDLYNTRHTFATHALASGEDPGWVAKMLGHTTLLMLMTRYYRYIPNLTRQDGSLLGKQLARQGRAAGENRQCGVSKAFRGLDGLSRTTRPQCYC